MKVEITSVNVASSALDTGDGQEVARVSGGLVDRHIALVYLERSLVGLLKLS